MSHIKSFCAEGHDYRIKGGQCLRRPVGGEGDWEPVSRAVAEADVWATYSHDQANSKLETHPVTAGVIAALAACQ